MKIGIVTLWHISDNYGQLLQSYALQTYLRNLGHEPFLIRHNSSGYSLYDGCFLLLRAIKNPCAIFKRQGVDCDVKSSVVLQKFEKFKEEFISSTDRIYNSIKELRADPPQAEIYICGSDQVWGNTYLQKHKAAHYLDFGDSKTLRIAYAASAGGRPFHRFNLGRLKKALANLDAIGVREQSLKEVCDDLGFSASRVVVDPTLLLPLDHYLDLCGGVDIDTQMPYIFVYVVNIKTPEELYFDKIKHYADSKQNLSIKMICSSGYFDVSDVLLQYSNISASPQEWLSYIHNARSVVTTSYHGVLFCIKMNRPFLVVLLQENVVSNGRVTELLDKLGLQDRIFDPTLSVEDQMDRSINWCDVNKRLDELIDESISFLQPYLNR
ncbi:MAG: polysaccharide pyruvyl transferase family protein [Rikenellaceae bacterium]